ncbi:MAG: hypothetical protein WCS87_16570 [Methylococcaceae bacterium]
MTVLLVPKLQLGNREAEAPASRDWKLELPGLHSQAGAWERVQPNTTDNTLLPASGATAIWKYKAIYRLHDEQVGQWSDMISVMVGG